MNFKGLTDKGRVRQSNQDAFCVGKIGNTPWAAVCDGMGGAAAGDIASSMTVERFKKLAESPDTKLTDSRLVERFFTSAITSANILVYEKALGDEALKGMGTTVVSCAVIENTAIIAHVGDSRAYYIKDNTITQITRDHSVVQTLVESGKITNEEAKTYIHKNIITRAVGVNGSVEIEFDQTIIEEGGIILLCTDGLTNMVPDSQILETVISDYENAEKLLIDLANKNGGQDNITAVLIKC